MTTSYPAALDAFTNPGPTDLLSAEVGGRTHSEFHADLNDAVEAVQAELGTTPSGAYATVAARLEAVYTSDLATGVNAAGYGNGGVNVTAVGYAALYSNTGASSNAVGHAALYSNTGAYSNAVGYQAGYLNTYAGVVLLGHQAVATAANQLVVGSASVPANTWHPGHDMDTYLDWATADTIKVYAGGQKALEVNETGGAPFLGFFGTAAVAKPTGVAVDAAGIHAALVTLGLIAA